MARRVRTDPAEQHDTDMRVRALSSGLRPLLHPACDPPVGPRPGAMEIAALIEGKCREDATFARQVPAEVEALAAEHGLLKLLLRGAHGYETRGGHNDG